VTIKWVLPVLPADPPPLPTARTFESGRAVDLICRGLASCPSYGKRFHVILQYAAPGVLARPNYVCADCLMELALVTEEETHG
jgi:hypothetical protein